MVADLMASVSLLSVKTKQAHTFMSSLHGVTRTNTTQCRLVLVVKVRRRTWKSITRALPTVRISVHRGFRVLTYSTLFVAGSLGDLIKHGLHALRETLQQDKELTISNTSIGIVGISGEHEERKEAEGAFRILEGETIDVYLRSMVPKEEAAEPAPAAGGAQAGDEDVQMTD